MDLSFSLTLIKKCRWFVLSKGHLKRGGVIHDFSVKSCMAIFNMRNGESANGERRNG